MTAEERDEAIGRALLYTFQLSDIDYRKMRTALSEVAFLRALEQDGFTITPLAEPSLIEGLRESFRLMDHLNEGGPPWTLAGIERVLDAGPMPPTLHVNSMTVGGQVGVGPNGPIYATPSPAARLAEALGVAYDLTRPEPKMSGPHYQTLGPVTAQKTHEAIVEAMKELGSLVPEMQRIEDERNAR